MTVSQKIKNSRANFTFSNFSALFSLSEKNEFIFMENFSNIFLLVIFNFLIQQ